MRTDSVQVALGGGSQNDRGGTIYATATGIPVPSFPPSPVPTEIGGGVVIPCFFTLVVEDLDKTIETLLVLSTF